MVHSDWLSARVAELGEHRVETMQTIRPTVSHYVPLTAELPFAFHAREMLHVPRSTFRFGAFVGENYLKCVKFLSTSNCVSCPGEIL